MNNYPFITRSEIEQHISPALLRVNTIITLAILAGPFILLIGIIVIYQTGQNIGTADSIYGTFIFLIRIFVIYLFLLYGAYIILPKFMLKSEFIKKRISDAEPGTPVETSVIFLGKLTNFDRQFMIIRLALLEGASLFGMVLLFMAINNGPVESMPEIWLFVVPSLIQLIITIKEYLPKEKLIQRIEKYISILNS
ncbi:MAG: hypothetical protein JXR46_06605 [Calditrichaceae bacterium]|nr:hypothetical protein [Calditrichaceae bacterium]MBN2708699.1 hypothetical protein [Calditrichaceae bacterium]RQV92811.1 MAG: hypothetical protein EH224_14295 [Calditrichota bacterium]